MKKLFFFVIIIIMSLSSLTFFDDFKYFVFIDLRILNLSEQEQLKL